MNNYCFDICEHNKVARNYWSDSDENGKVINHSKALRTDSDGPKFKLICDVGYKQTINSHKAFINSNKNNALICPRLRALFAKKEK